MLLLKEKHYTTHLCDRKVFNICQTVCVLCIIVFLGIGFLPFHFLLARSGSRVVHMVGPDCLGQFLRRRFWRHHSLARSIDICKQFALVRACYFALVFFVN